MKKDGKHFMRGTSNTFPGIATQSGRQGFWMRLTHTPRLGTAPLGVSLAHQSSGTLQSVASLAAHLAFHHVGGAAVAAPQEAMLGP